MKKNKTSETENLFLSQFQRIEMMEDLFELLAGVMNKIHETDYSIRFWKIILVSHVKAVISRRSVLSRYEVRRKPDLFAVNSRRIPSGKAIYKQRLIDFAKHLKSRKNLKKIKSVLSSSHRVRIGFFEYPGLENEGIGMELPNYHPFMIGRGDRNKRETVNRIADAQEDLFYANAVRELPKILVEHFEKLTGSLDLIHPQKKELHVHTTQSVFNEVLIASYVELGARLIWYQHGSYYGEFDGDSEHHYEHSISDEYRTWGWKIKERDKPWKAYRLEKFRGEYEKYPNQKSCDLLISFSKISDKNVESSKEVTDYLLSRLNPKKYKRILARPQPANKVFNQKSQLDFISSSRVIKSTGLTHMAEDMSKCRVILQMRVPSTNFLECVYTNHPTVGILKVEEPTDVVRPFYEFFLEQGVLHPDLKSLTLHLNNINVEEWWETVVSQKMFSDYREAFTAEV